MDRRRILLVVAVLVAALGAGLVFLYARGADDRATSSEETTMVLVVNQKILPGESAADAANAGKIALAPIPDSALLPGATADGNVFKGEFALTTLYPGEQLIPDRFGSTFNTANPDILNPPPGDVSVQIQMGDPNRVGSFLLPGDHVAIFLIPPFAQPPSGDSTAPGTGSPTGSPIDGTVGNTATDNTPPASTTSARARVLLSDVQVLAVGSTVPGTVATDSSGAPIAASPTTSITLALSQEEAELIGGIPYGATSGKLFFGLRNDASKIKVDLDLDAVGLGKDS